jgi:dephospho-CoA kinase
MTRPPTRVLRIGLTGGIASGKSTVSAAFTQLGVPVIDADEVAREVVAPGTPGLRSVVQRFGNEVLDPAGALNRSVLRAMIFQDPQARRDLEAILHPLIRHRMETLADATAGPYVVMAIPLLVEGGPSDRVGDRVDRILVVDTEESAQVQRVVTRDHVDEAQARAILAAQASRAQRLSVADDVLENSGSVAQLRQAVEKLHGQYLQLAAAAH